MIIRQKISNFPIDSTVERYVVIKKFSFDSIYKAITIDANIEFIKDGEDVSKFYKTSINNWIISNRYSIKQDNPDHYMKDDNGEFLLDENDERIPVEPEIVYEEVDGVMVEVKIPLLDENGLNVTEHIVTGQDDNGNDIVDVKFVMVTKTTQPPMYLEFPAYDYFMGLIFDGNIPLGDLIQSYILSDDAKGEFNK